LGDKLNRRKNQIDKEAKNRIPKTGF